MYEREGTPALTDQEWRQRFFQRGRLTGCGFDGDAISLIRRGADGAVDAVRLDEDDARRAVAALLLQSHSGRLTWQDHDDQVLTALLLSSYQMGTPFEELGEPLQEALQSVLDRCGSRAARIADLLPPRPEPNFGEETP